MIPWLYDIINVCVRPAGVNHNQSLGPLGLPGRPGFSPEKPALRAAGPKDVRAGPAPPVSNTGCDCGWVYFQERF